MDDGQKTELREDLEFAILRVERLAALDALEAPPSPRHPLELEALADVLAVFGFARDDLIDAHDQRAIFRRVRAELEDALRRLASDPSQYDKAALLRDRLRRMKREFVDRQRGDEARRQQAERARLATGAELRAARSAAEGEARERETEREARARRADLDETHAVQRAQLDAFLARLEAPPVKRSKLLLQLQSTEKSLARLRLFEDARTVSVRADALERDERARSAAGFAQRQQLRREQLRAQQAAERAELDEKLSERRYATRRRNDALHSTEKQRVANLETDMRHAHALDMHAKRVFSTDAAPRRAHAATSSSFRGQQLLRTVQGRRLEVASLCATHDRERGVVPDGSVVFTG